MGAANKAKPENYEEKDTLNYLRILRNQASPQAGWDNKSEQRGLILQIHQTTL
jgi:hypothetical protein